MDRGGRCPLNSTPTKPSHLNVPAVCRHDGPRYEQAKADAVRGILRAASVFAKTANSLMISSWCPRMNALTDMVCSARSPAGLNGGNHERTSHVSSRAGQVQSCGVAQDTNDSELVADLLRQHQHCRRSGTGARVHRRVRCQTCWKAGSSRAACSIGSGTSRSSRWLPFQPVAADIDRRAERRLSRRAASSAVRSHSLQAPLQACSLLRCIEGESGR